MTTDNFFYLTNRGSSETEHSYRSTKLFKKRFRKENVSNESESERESEGQSERERINCNKRKTKKREEN